MLNLYPNYFIAKGKTTDAYIYAEYYDDDEGGYDDYEYDEDYAEYYNQEAGDKFFVLRVSAVPFYKVN